MQQTSVRHPRSFHYLLPIAPHNVEFQKISIPPSWKTSIMEDLHHGRPPIPLEAPIKLHTFCYNFWPYRTLPPGNSNTFCGRGGEYRYFLVYCTCAREPLAKYMTSSIRPCIQKECPRQSDKLNMKCCFGILPTSTLLR